MKRAWEIAAGAAALGLVGAALRERLRPSWLEGRVALVTGGSRGLGLLIAEELLGRGCTVAICARDRQELDAAVDQLEPHGTVAAWTCDVADEDAVVDMIDGVERELGPIDLVVNNAAIIQVGPVGAMSSDDFRRAMDVIFFGTLHTSLALLPRMKTRGGGRMVNITSIGGKVAVPHLLPYDAAKFASVGFSEGLRAEARQDGVLVTTVVPGLMRTGSPVNALFKGDAEAEYDWFSLGDATPLTAMSARRAAQRIVEAAERGEAEVTLSWQASMLRGLSAAAPGAMSELLGLVNRLLPDDESTEEVRGHEVDDGDRLEPATRLMHRAARRNNQYGGSRSPKAPR